MPILPKADAALKQRTVRDTSWGIIFAFPAQNTLPAELGQRLDLA